MATNTVTAIAIDQLERVHGLTVDSYRPGRDRLYSVWSNKPGPQPHHQRRLAGGLKAAELRAWAEGYAAAIREEG
jgi:hypothetical protein